MNIDMEALGLGFLNINHDADGKMLLYDKDTLGQLNRTEHEQLRSQLLELTTRYRGHVVHPPGSQFWVRRDRILRHPREFYVRLLEALRDPHHSLLGRSAALQGYPKRTLHVFFMEGYWHYLFGEPEDYVLPHRNYRSLTFFSGANWTVRNARLRNRRPCNASHFTWKLEC